MDNAKKIKLKSIGDKALSQLDKDISAILNADLVDDEKAKQYVTLLRRYKIYSTPAPKPPVDPVKELLELIQPNLRIKARQLLDHLKPEVKWTPKAEFIHDYRVIPDCHIAELVDDVLQKKTDDEPEG